MKPAFLILYREMVLRWNLERSHAVIAVAYGVYIQRAQTFSGPGIAFNAMDQVARAVVPSVDAETAWGTLMILAGLSTLGGVVSRNVFTRQGSALVLSALWALMGLCFFASNARSPACVVYAVLAYAAFTRFWQARQPQHTGDLHP